MFIDVDTDRFRRWIRLLFGREFDFKDVLKVWDLLFAENLTSDIVDMTCVAILLRVRWQCVYFLAKD